MLFPLIVSARRAGIRNAIVIPLKLYRHIRVGVEQINVKMPASLAGKGNVIVRLTAGSVAANPVQITVQ